MDAFLFLSRHKRIIIMVECQYRLHRNSEKDGGIETDEQRDGMQLPYPWKVQ